MSELKAFRFVLVTENSNLGGAVYNSKYVYAQDDVDKLIAEKDKEIAKLKDKCQMHDFFWEGCGFDKLGFKNAIQVREHIDKIQARAKTETERLVRELNEKEIELRLKAEDCVLLGNQIQRFEQDLRTTRRNLWLARLRSLRNFSVLAYFQTLRAKGKESKIDFDEIAYRIDLARVKCHKKAEEYK